MILPIIHYSENMLFRKEGKNVFKKLFKTFLKKMIFVTENSFDENFDRLFYRKVSFF